MTLPDLREQILCFLRRTNNVMQYFERSSITDQGFVNQLIFEQIMKWYDAQQKESSLRSYVVDSVTANPSGLYRSRRKIAPTLLQARYRK